MIDLEHIARSIFYRTYSAVDDDEPGEHDMGAVQVTSLVGFEHVTQEQLDIVMAATEIYMKEKVIGVMHKRSVAMCKNEHENCAVWAAAGECDKSIACKCGW
jgi:hypothetical protein